VTFHPSTCPFCSCACALLLHEEDGRLLGSYPRVGAAGRSTLCIRGWNCTSNRSHPDRLTAPMVRGSNGLVRASWREAVEEVAGRLGGASSPPLFAVGPSLANEDVVAVRRLASLLGARLCTTDLSGATAARFALQQVLGRGYGFRDLETIASSDLIWVLGADLDECPQVASRVVHARRDGGAIVRIDVHASGGGDGSRAVTIPPDQFGLLPLVLQKTIFDADLAVPEAGGAAGFEELARYWRHAPAFGERTWMPDEDALALVREFRAAQRPIAIMGSRWLTSARAEDHTVQLLQALALLGAADRVLAAVGEANSWGSLDVLGPESSPAELACREDGLDTLIVVADDLIRRSPRPATLADTLDRLRTVVVIDRFTTDTLPFADVVLPSCTFAETDGTTTNVFGAVQYWRRAVLPPGDCCPERVWASRIGHLFGVEEWPGDGRVAPQVDARTRLTFAPPPAEAASLESGADDAFPMRMVLGSHVANFSTGTVTQREELLGREMIESTLAAAPAVLEALGVKPGWPARLLVPGDEATVTVRADRRLPTGVLVLVPLAGSLPVRLRGCYPGPGRRSVGLQPVPARLERA
jgi:anaerobic selenocysteine-containing dehydrogenase